MVSAQSAFYGLLGLRLDADGALARWIDADVGVAGGYGSDAADGRWWSGTAGLDFSRLERQLVFASRIEGFGLSYVDPFDYSALGLALYPRISRSTGQLMLSVLGNLEGGQWRAPLPAGSTETDVATKGDLRNVGGSVTAQGGWGPLGLELAAEGLHAVNGSADGNYGGVTAGASYVLPKTSLHLSVTGWHSPAGGELGYGADLTTALSPGVNLTAAFERSVADPRYGTPGALGASVGLSLRLGVARSHRPSVVEVGPVSGGSRRVRFRVRADRDDANVKLAGSFNQWQPVEMRLENGWWRADLELPPGTYRFSFVRGSGEWFVPASAPGVVDDGWGRKNIVFVVPSL